MNQQKFEIINTSLTLIMRFGFVVVNILSGLVWICKDVQSMIFFSFFTALCWFVATIYAAIELDQLLKKINYVNSVGNK